MVDESVPLGGYFAELSLDANRASRAGRRSGTRSYLPAPYRPFPLTLLPEPVSTYIAAACTSIGCDPTFVALPLLSALGSVIGNSRCIELKRGWIEPPIIWTAIVGHSGSAKSPAFSAALDPIRRRQSLALIAHADAMREHRRAEELYEADRAEWKKRRAGDPPVVPTPPIARRFTCSDTTVEALAFLLHDNPRGLLLCRDELGAWLSSFDAYRSGKGGDAAQYLEMYRAGPLTVDRKSTRTVLHVERAFLCITGGIQPAILAKSLGVEHFASGMAARFLFGMPPRVPRRWTEAVIPAAVTAALETIIDRLLALAPNSDMPGHEPVRVPLSASGKERWIKFFNAHSEEQSQLDDNLAAAWAKLEAYAARFALLVHELRRAAKDPTLEHANEVDVASVEAGVGLSKWFGQETERVYAVIDAGTDQGEQRDLLERVVRLGGRCTVRQLMHAARKYRGSSASAESALQTLVDAGLAEWQSDAASPNGGPQSRACVLIEDESDATGNECPIGEGENVVSLPLPETEGVSFESPSATDAGVLDAAAEELRPPSPLSQPDRELGELRPSGMTNLSGGNGNERRLAAMPPEHSLPASGDARVEPSEAQSGFAFERKSEVHDA